MLLVCVPLALAAQTLAGKSTAVQSPAKTKALAPMSCAAPGAQVNDWRANLGAKGGDACAMYGEEWGGWRWLDLTGASFMLRRFFQRAVGAGPEIARSESPILSSGTRRRRRRRRRPA